MKMKYATKEDFSKAPLGHPFLECCSICLHETGNIMVKSRGHSSDKPADSFSIPKHIVSHENHCEFCNFVSVYLAHEKIDPKETGEQYGAMKLVFVQPDTSQKLFAFVPFSGTEQKEGAKLKDGTEFTIKHRMIVEVVHGKGPNGEETADMVKIIEEGV